MFDSFKLCDINMSEKEEKHFSPVIGGSKHYIRQGKARQWRGLNPKVFGMNLGQNICISIYVQSLHP